MRQAFHGQRGETSVLVWIAVVVVIGALAAIPFVLMSRGENEHNQQALGAVDTSKDALASTDLDVAVRNAETYFAENGSYDGFSSQTASQFDNSITYNTSPTAITGQVSIRAPAGQSVVLVTRSQNGSALCAGLTADVVVHGTVDAASAAQCTGG